MADALASLPPDVVATEGPRGRILVIDDEPDIREGLEALLAGENYHVTLASNATEGLKRLEAAPFDLVLLDLMMPDKSGMQVLEEGRARDQETPIFMMTPYGPVGFRGPALNRAAQHDLPNPCEPER